MSKQDRQAVRTARDIETKYDLGRLKTASGSAAQEIQISNLTQTMNQYMADTNAKIEEIEETQTNKADLVDGKVSSEQLPEITAISPTVDVTEIEGGHRVTVTDANGVESFDVMNGTDGQDGTSIGFGFKRVLTSADDLNTLFEEGVYRYSTSSVPANCPYSNAGVVEVIHSGSDSSGIIQRVSRYGEAGHTKQRILYSDSWLAWTIVPLIFKKTYTATTNANGNANTSINCNNYTILSISAKDSSGSETYICNLYKSTANGGRWYVNVTSVTSKENVANTSLTFTIYYIVV